MVIAMFAIMIAAVGIDKGMKFYNAKKWEKERVERYEMARADVAQIQMTISELSQDQAAIEAFIEENKEYFEDMLEVETEEGKQDVLPADGMGQETGEDLLQEDDNVSGNEVMDVSGDSLRDVSGNFLGDVSGNGMEDVSGNSLEDVSGNGLDTVSGNDTISGNDTVSGNETTSGMGGEEVASGSTLLEKRKIRGSYAETILRNGTDKKLIAESQTDFSEMKIACLGDSITAAANLESMEDYQQYAYPAQLQKILGAGEVVNLGIGGSSIGRYWENAFVDRYREIPEDTDLIIVMGGTNDGFCMHEEDFGTMEERKENTFIGDMDELMKGLKENYPDATVVFVTPLPNVLHDMLRKERSELLPQSRLVGAMKQMAAEYEIPVIDLYNSNILDSHDAAIIYNYVPDGVHCNPAGYKILAEHFAAELIQMYASQENDEERPEDAVSIEE